MVDKEKVKKVIEKIRPQLQMDGGDLELLDITDDGIVKI
ncbi:MAG: NifU family protein, partial [Candidatus Lokiarchaeota archaeon]